MTPQQKMMEVDRRNTARLKEIIAAHGWPTKSMVGMDGTRSAWLMAQHADQDLPFQKTVLSLMEAHRKTGEVHLVDLAYLTDRVRVNEGGQQLYGSQGRRVDGAWQPKPIDNAGGVNARRESMGMQPLEEYAAFMNT